MDNKGENVDGGSGRTNHINVPHHLSLPPPLPAWNARNIIPGFLCVGTTVGYSMDHPGHTVEGEERRRPNLKPKPLESFGSSSLPTMRRRKSKPSSRPFNLDVPPPPPYTHYSSSRTPMRYPGLHVQRRKWKLSSPPFNRDVPPPLPTHHYSSRTRMDTPVSHKQMLELKLSSSPFNPDVPPPPPPPTHHSYSRTATAGDYPFDLNFPPPPSPTHYFNTRIAALDLNASPPVSPTHHYYSRTAAGGDSHDANVPQANDTTCTTNASKANV